MSYQYAQYGIGFDLKRPEPQALRFEALLTIRGTAITVIQQTLTGRDSYGQPIYTENPYTLKAFIERNPDERYFTAGEVNQDRAVIYLAQWAPLDESLYKLEINSARYHITGVEQTDSYLKVEARRMIR